MSPTAAAPRRTSPASNALMRPTTRASHADKEGETTGQPYVEGNLESEVDAACGGGNVEDRDAIGDDTPDLLVADGSDIDNAADNLRSAETTTRPMVRRKGAR